MYRPAAKRTAIKIPGKRSRSTTKADVAARKALSRPPGRPLKVNSSETSSRSSDNPTRSPKKVKRRSLKNIKSRRKMSPLEKLPTELLERVFFYCMNLDLPRCSPIIGGRLSSDAIYTRTILAAFEPTWEQYYTVRDGIPPAVVGDSKLQVRTTANRIQDYLASNKVLTLQSAIFRCRWASLSLLLKSQDIYMRRRNSHRIKLEPTLWFASEDGEGKELEDAIMSSKTVAQRFDKDFAQFLDFIERAKFDESFWDSSNELFGMTAELAQGVEIPHSLLLGPWTEGMIRYLYWIVKSGAQFDWSTSTNGEVALLGLERTILAGNTPVIYLLILSGLQWKLDGKFMTWALRNVGDNKAAIMDLLLLKAKWSSVEKDSFEYDLAEDRDKAEREGNQERLLFLNSLKVRPV